MEPIIDDERAVASRFRFPRGLGFFGAGAMLAVFFALMPRPDASPSPQGTPGSVALWAADRDASRVFGLDAGLFLARRIVCDYPLEVQGCADGGLWTLRSPTDHPGPSQRLMRYGANGTLITELFLRTCIELDTLDGDQALVIEEQDAGNLRLDRVQPEGSLFPLLLRPDLMCTCGSQGTALIGTRSGVVARVDAHSGTILSQLLIGGQIGDIAPGPTPGSAWALDVEGQGRLMLLDANLAVRWSVNVQISARHLAPVRGEERVWLADTITPRVRRFGPNGVLELDRPALPLTGLDRAVAWRDGGVLVAAPGGILHLDAYGQVAPGQGGFAWLSDLATAR